MKQIQKKFIDAIMAIDFEKLSIDELNTLANAAEKIKELDKDVDSYLHALTEKIGTPFPSAPKETLKDLR